MRPTSLPDAEQGPGTGPGPVVLASARRAAAVAAFALGALLGPGTGQASFDPPTVLVGGYQVFATLPDAEGGPPREVVATLRDAAGARLATATAFTDAFGAVEVDFTTHGHGPRRPIHIRPDHRVTLSDVEAFGGHPSPLTIRVQPLTARPDIALDAVAGTAPPGTRVTVTASVPGEGFASTTVEAGPEGTWSAPFGHALDLVAGASGAAYFEAYGAYFQADWTARRVEGSVGSGTLGIKTWAGDTATATLYDAGGEVLAVASAVAWNGGSETTAVDLRDTAGDLVPLTPERRLVVDFEDGERFEELLPRLSIDVSAASDMVMIRTAPGLEVSATTAVDGAERTLTAVAEADGRALLDFGAAGIDLDPEQAVDVRAADSLLARARAFEPAVVETDPLVVAVEGRGAAGSPVAIEVITGGETIRLADHVGADGRFALVARDGASRPIALGAEAIASASLELAGREIALPREPLLAWAHAGRDTVEGEGAPGQGFTVEAGGHVREPVAGPDGRWTADFGDVLDIEPGQPITVVRDRLGSAETRLVFPVFRVTAQPGTDRVRVEGHPGLETLVELTREGETIAGGACAIERDVCELRLTGADGGDGAEPVRVTAGDGLSAFPSEGASASIDVVGLTAHIEPGGFDVTGAAPPDDAVRITFANDQGIPTPLDTTISADSTGVYDYELTADQYELLVPGLVAEVTYDLADGHRVMAVGVVEVLRIEMGDGDRDRDVWGEVESVDGDGDRDRDVWGEVESVDGDGEPVRDSPVFSGLAEPGSPVRLRLEPLDPSGGEPFVFDAVAGPDGAFVIDPSAGAASPAPATTAALEAGARVTLEHRRGTIALDLPAFGAWRASAAGAIAGVGTAGGTVRALHRLHDVPRELVPPGRDLADVLTADGRISLNGAFRIDPPSAASAGAVRAIEVVAYPAPGAELRRRIASRLPGPSVYLPTSVR